MYSDTAAVAAVPAGAAGAALFAPTQVAIGLVIVAVATALLGALMGMRAARVSAK